MIIYVKLLQKQRIISDRENNFAKNSGAQENFTKISRILGQIAIFAKKVKISSKMKNLATNVPTSILRSGKKSELASKPERVQAAWTSIDKDVLGAVDD